MRTEVRTNPVISTFVCYLPQRNETDICEIPHQDHRGVNLISDALPFGRLWYGDPDAISNAIGYAKFFSRSHDAVICVYDKAGNMIETHEQAG